MQWINISLSITEFEKCISNIENYCVYMVEIQIIFYFMLFSLVFHYLILIHFTCLISQGNFCHLKYIYWYKVNLSYYCEFSVIFLIVQGWKFSSYKSFFKNIFCFLEYLMLFKTFKIYYPVLWFCFLQSNTFFILGSESWIFKLFVYFIV